MSPMREEKSSFHGMKVHYGRSNGHEGYPKDALLEILSEYAERIGEVPSDRKMRNDGPISPSPYHKAFGSWNESLKSAGLKPVEKQSVEKEDLVSSLQDFADDIGHTPKMFEMRDDGPYWASTYAYRFGSWNEALEEAGLEVNRERLPDISEDDLIDEIQRLANELGHTPTCEEMNDEGKYFPSTYRYHFGFWNDAVQKAGLEINDQRGPLWKDQYRGPNWFSIIKKIRERDNHECVICGLSNQVHKVMTNQKLHVHHIVPLQEFAPFDGRDDPKYDEANSFENLITLCRQCHIRWEGIEL